MFKIIILLKWLLCKNYKTLTSSHIFSNKFSKRLIKKFEVFLASQIFLRFSTNTQYSTI
jgi:hypothetical protein